MWLNLRRGLLGPALNMKKRCEHDPLAGPPGALAWGCIVRRVTQAADMNSARGIMSNRRPAHSSCAFCRLFCCCCCRRRLCYCAVQPVFPSRPPRRQPPTDHRLPIRVRFASAEEMLHVCFQPETKMSARYIKTQRHHGSLN